jgi:hypothetical protein
MNSWAWGNPQQPDDLVSHEKDRARSIAAIGYKVWAIIGGSQQ